ncbi:hypothetical protein LCGC14_1956750 [marine sediment metagenome]|uniref:Uncharacterized protein n=1 Tax=marine sediment metagenome TaxID=412755 RepID=A0A0F9HU61_9ZZZZ
MGRRSVHYEAAFESYLQAMGWPYVVVDEAKKAVFADVSIKSFDFLVYADDGPNLLVDVKGRKFPDSGGPAGGSSRAWENWVTAEDVESLGEWENIFGSDFLGMFVFAYWLQGPPSRAPFQDVHFFRKRHYAFQAIRLTDYAVSARQRSAKWRTLSMPAGQFRRLAAEVGTFLTSDQ